MRVKISVRAECSPVNVFSANGEFADAASSTGRTGRIASVTATARSGPRMPTCTWLLKVLLRHATYWSSPSTSR
jgi:hypothetical protein